jgi:hypothetical protein
MLREAPELEAKALFEHLPQAIALPGPFTDLAKYTHWHRLDFANGFNPQPSSPSRRGLPRSGRGPLRHPYPPGNGSPSAPGTPHKPPAASPLPSLAESEVAEAEGFLAEIQLWLPILGLSVFKPAAASPAGKPMQINAKGIAEKRVPTSGGGGGAGQKRLQ